MRAAPVSAVLDFASSHALALIVLIAAVLRFATIGLPSYWLDEYVSLSETQGSLSTVLDSVNRAEGGPPLYLLLLWGWRNAFGDGEIVIRSMSALLGTATVPVAFAAARELASRRAGLYAAALDRDQPALGLVFAGSAHLRAARLPRGPLVHVLRLYARARGAPVALGLGDLSGLAFTTHYFAVVLIVPEAAWLLVRGPRVKTLIACAGIGAAGLAVGLLAGINQQQDKVAGVIRGLDRVDRVVAIPQHLVVGLSVPWRALPILVGVLLVAAVVHALRRADPFTRHDFALAGGIGMAGFLLAVVPAFFGADYVITRYVLELWLPFAVAVAIALAVPSIGRLGMAAVVPSRRSASRSAPGMPRRLPRGGSTGTPFVGARADQGPEGRGGPGLLREHRALPLPPDDHLASSNGANPDPQPGPALPEAGALTTAIGPCFGAPVAGARGSGARASDPGAD